MYRLPELPYEYDALEPHIDAETMKIHHGKHHGGYVEKLNKALEGAPDLKDRDLAELLADIEAVPESIRTAVRNNGGGHANHSLFWQVMSPGKSGQPEGDLARTISDRFGDLASLRRKFTETASGRFGSGWAWLLVDDGRLEVSSTPNQDSPLMEGKTPILGLDVWEHAYYLRYQNRRADYIDAWWNLVDWSAVAKRYDSVMTASAVSVA